MEEIKKEFNYINPKKIDLFIMKFEEILNKESFKDQYEKLAKNIYRKGSEDISAIERNVGAAKAYNNTLGRMFFDEFRDNDYNDAMRKYMDEFFNYFKSLNESQLESLPNISELNETHVKKMLEKLNVLKDGSWYSWITWTHGENIKDRFWRLTDYDMTKMLTIYRNSDHIKAALTAAKLEKIDIGWAVGVDLNEKENLRQFPALVARINDKANNSEKIISYLSTLSNGWLTEKWDENFYTILTEDEHNNKMIEIAKTIDKLDTYKRKGKLKLDGKYYENILKIKSQIEQKIDTEEIDLDGFDEDVKAGYEELKNDFSDFIKDKGKTKEFFRHISKIKDIIEKLKQGKMQINEQSLKTKIRENTIQEIKNKFKDMFLNKYFTPAAFGNKDIRYYYRFVNNFEKTFKKQLNALRVPEQEMFALNFVVDEKMDSKSLFNYLKNENYINENGFVNEDLIKNIKDESNFVIDAQYQDKKKQIWKVLTNACSKTYMELFKESIAIPSMHDNISNIYELNNTEAASTWSFVKGYRWPHIYTFQTFMIGLGKIFSYGFTALIASGCNFNTNIS